MRSTPTLVALGLGLMVGCGTQDEEPTWEPTPSASPIPDHDHDGFLAYNDCDDWNKNVHPGATEFSDATDNDCDGRIDEGTSAYDDDRDGFTEDQGDCDDTTPSIHPGATESRNGGDDDCDGAIDEGVGDPSIDIVPPEPADPTSSLARAILFNDQGDETQTAWIQGLLHVGDLDLDGYADAAFSQGQGDGGSRVFLYYGGPDAPGGVGSLQDEADAVVTGYALPNSVGVGLAGARDLNGDDAPDLVLGDARHRELGIFFGGGRLEGALTLDEADCRIRAGQDSGFAVGRFIALPDLDGDGLADLALSQPDHAYGSGRVLVFYGRETWPKTLDIAQADLVLEGDETLAFFGFELHALGDLDGDGAEELLIGSPNALIREGVDTDGDGIPDVAPILGDLQLFYGTPGLRGAPRPGVKIVPADSSALTPITTATGDLDGDGAPDLAIGIPLDGSGAGRLLLRYGDRPLPEGTLTLPEFADATIRGQLNGADVAFGIALDVADVDLDGVDDLLIGAQRTYLPSEGHQPRDLMPPTLAPGYLMVISGLTAKVEGSDLGTGHRTLHPGAPGVMETVEALSVVPQGEDASPEVWVGSSFLVYDVPTTGLLIFDGGALP